MTKGDLVRCITYHPAAGYSLGIGIIIRFNETGEGGKDYVHVFCENKINIFMAFDVEVINESG